MTSVVLRHPRLLLPHGRAATAATGALLLAYVLAIVLLVRQREILSKDTFSNYVHVWYIAEELWNGGGLPFRMPVLASGDALAYPYGFLPWTVAALLWPILDERAVGVCLVAGFVAMVVATFVAFPELRRGWWMVAALVNPALPQGLLLGQMPFMWAAALFLAAIACWRRGRHGWAGVLGTAAMVNHPAVLIPIVALVVAIHWRAEPEKRTLRRCWLLSTAAALPAAALVFASPVADDSSIVFTLWIALETVANRSLVVIVPMILIALQRRGLERNRVAALAGLLVLIQLATFRVSGLDVGFQALNREPRNVIPGLTADPAFVPGATYRVLSAWDAKYGPYAVVRAGGRLDSEFFPESMRHVDFGNVERYGRFLAGRRVDFVVLDHAFRHLGTDEESLLRTLAEPGRCGGQRRAELVVSRPQVDLYAVHPC